MDEVIAQGEDVSVAVDRDLDLVDLAALLVGGDEVLAAVADPAAVKPLIAALASADDVVKSDFMLGLVIGLLANVFTAVFVSRVIFDFWYKPQERPQTISI